MRTEFGFPDVTSLDSRESLDSSPSLNRVEMLLTLVLNGQPSPGKPDVEFETFEPISPNVALEVLVREDLGDDLGKE